MGFLGALTGSDVGKATKNAANQNKGLITSFQTTGNNIINTGEQKSEGAINSAIGAYSPWVGTGQQANALYSDALGLNGAEGNARATGAFQTGPGYDFAVDESMRAAERAASAGGTLSSGNLLAALQDRGNNLANQEFSSWLDRLNGQSAQGLTAASGQAAGYNNLAGLYQSTAGDRLGLESGVTQGLLGVNNQIAQADEAKTAAKGSFLGGLLKGGIGIATKAASGGLF